MNPTLASLDPGHVPLEQSFLKFIAAIEEHADAFPAPTLNLLKAARLQRQEIRHSNLLAFFLDPSQPHGLSDEFIKQLLLRVAPRDASASAPFSRLLRSMEGYADVQVRREMMNMDVLIWSERSRMLLAIEAKVDARQGDKQLLQYRQRLEEEFKDYSRDLLFLTTDGVAPNDDMWIPVTWEDMYRSLMDAMRRKTDVLSERARFAIEQYLELLSSEVLVNEVDMHLVNVCRKLYSEHKRVIDLIIEHGAVSSFTEAAEEFLFKSTDIRKISLSPTRAAFLPAKIDEACLAGGFTTAKGNYWGQDAAIIMWFALDGAKLALIVEVGPWADAGRQEAVLGLKNIMPPKGRVNRKLSETYSRIWSYRMNFSSDDPGTDEIIEKMKALYERIEGETESISGFIRTLNKQAR
ncbi:PD-(D/E)XK nuclease family protein [Massilia sp. ST3]|uniref:PDDEXK-like family protein n=1 Tax=Massilia sp. ST3 TaxID=2824903 RepID=UPI001B83F7AD|nr:PD-(D/E)XK nuclease family protein [Massilia sp. ST3]MBQ5946242.1 PD-(D/E)XK nuclease family protein [Massilia sp. ST3]